MADAQDGTRDDAPIPDDVLTAAIDAEIARTCGNVVSTRGRLAAAQLVRHRVTAAVEVAWRAGLAARRPAAEDGNGAEIEYGAYADRLHADDESQLAWTISADSPLARQMLDDEDPADLVWRAVSPWQAWPPPAVAAEPSPAAVDGSTVTVPLDLFREADRVLSHPHSYAQDYLPEVAARLRAAVPQLAEEGR